MFDHHKNELDQLLSENIEFRRLYNKHQDLDAKVDEAENGKLAMDEMSLHKLKKEKLLMKDRLQDIMRDYCD